MRLPELGIFEHECHSLTVIPLLLSLLPNSCLIYKLSIAGRSIWIVGSSLIRNASQHIRRRPVGQDLGLQRYGYLVSWAGYGSLILDEVIGVTKTLLQIEYAPNYFVLHAAGNDVGRIS